jgi:hypothetical protein
MPWPPWPPPRASWAVCPPSLPGDSGVQPRSAVSAVNAAASRSVSWRDQGTRFDGFAPGPVLLYSAKVVFWHQHLLELAQPPGGPKLEHIVAQLPNPGGNRAMHPQPCAAMWSSRKVSL